MALVWGNLAQKADQEAERAEAAARADAYLAAYQAAYRNSYERQYKKCRESYASHGTYPLPESFEVAKARCNREAENVAKHMAEIAAAREAGAAAIR